MDTPIPNIAHLALSSGPQGQSHALPPGAQAHEDEQALSSGEAATLGRIVGLLDGVIAEEAGEPSEGNGEPSVDPRLTEARSLSQALINSSSY